MGGNIPVWKYLGANFAGRFFQGGGGGGVGGGVLMDGNFSAGNFLESWLARYV